MPSSDKKRFWLAVLLAPIAASIVWVLWVVTWGEQKLDSKVFGGFLTTLPFAYGGMVFIGLPVVLLLRKASAVNVIALSLSGGIGGVTYVSLLALLFGRYPTSLGLEVTALCAVQGMAVAVVFYAIAGITKRSNRSRRSGAPV